MDRKAILADLIATRFGGSQADFGRAIGKSPAQVNQWLSGVRNFGDASARHTEITLGLGQGYFDGTGPMLPSTTQSNIGPGPFVERLVPLISWVQAGTWHEASDPYQPGESDEWLYYPKKNGHSVYALRVQGDSMTAKIGKSYPEGCIIFVDPERRSPVSGERIIAKLAGNDAVTFKVFVQDETGRCWLRPLNESYEPIRDPFKVIGTVVGKWEDE